MLSAALLLFANTLLLSLRLSGGSFPKPLSAAEEQDCLRRCAQVFADTMERAGNPDVLNNPHLYDLRQ